MLYLKEHFSNERGFPLKHPYLRVKLGCYATNVTMAILGNLSPLLFLTFRSLYGISYSLLGLLVLVNFCTQLGVDLLFSFFSHKFNIPATVRLTPVLSILGLLLYAAAPLLFPGNIYLGLLLGTVIFSSASGLAEVLISPLIAALPAKNPEREMSKLHSVYAWGSVATVLFCTLFLLLAGQTSWQILALLLCVIPLCGTILFAGAKIPKMQTTERVSGALAMLRNKSLWICILAIFLGGAAECTMAQWSSGYLECSLGIPKVWGDIFGVAMFGLTLGIGRTLYAKRGRRIESVLYLGAIGATVCYLLAALSPIPLIGLLACAMTGLCTSMMWPGSLIVVADRFPAGGVFIYAIMAAGGDLGASVGPQLVGIATDAISASALGEQLASLFSLSAEQVGMKAGLLIGSLFPLVGILVYRRLRKTAPASSVQKNS